ncbi:MAG TPA: family 16 glycosylhydrolase [Phototrophicaceae bacterium]|jgi:hypothetical protein|nr:family 16 glycosylhydrolase [Phototrophicaceae bacterium]
MSMIVTEIGQGKVTETDERVDLTVAARYDEYSNAQIASYKTRHDFSYIPPLRMTLMAQVTGELRGTAGFGFWNHPYVPGERGFRLPRAVWFFHASPPNNIALAKGVPGYGWKAATFDATRWQFLTLLPTAPIGFLLMRIPKLYNLLWSIGQQAIGVHEQLLNHDLLKSSHRYTIEWLPDEIRFLVDDQLVHCVRLTIKGKLGFIAWVDNQYAIVTPQGHFGAGLMDHTGEQILMLNQIEIKPL